MRILRELSYSNFREFYASPFEGGKYADFLEDNLHIVDEQSFVEECEFFYPKGMFGEIDPIIYFFTLKGFHQVDIKIDNMTVRSWNNSEISSVELIIPDRYNLGLVVHLRSGEQIKFNSKSDTNSTWSKKFKKEIEEIYKHLTNSLM